MKEGHQSLFVFSLFGLLFPPAFKKTCTAEISLPQLLQEAASCLFIAASVYAPILLPTFFLILVF